MALKRGGKKMIKQILVMHKNPILSDSEFYKYWKDIHGPLAAKTIPGMRRYVQNHLVSMPGTAYEGDGICEIWFDNFADLQRSMDFIKSPEGRECAEDADKIFASRDVKYWVAEEHVII
jgi:uncharacterized protein (TIGR02118 family)